ncbi:MAG: gamma-glutamyltransferase [candidate division Zixibacteria bacterium]|nr:gamma-glutamyltransferase [candidate division Zixibacteria bacterium]
MKTRMILIGFLIGLLITLFSLISCNGIQTEKLFQNGIVVCADPISAEHGLEILKSGGNAIDAACATAFSLAVTLPRAGNIGGGGFAMVYLADSQKVFFIDFRETAPSGSDATGFLSGERKVDRAKATVGPLSAGVPGTVAGLYEMHNKLGRADWTSLVKPARLLADTGFITSNYLAESIESYREELSRFASTGRIFLPEGVPIKAGYKFAQKDLSRTLGLIEANGRDGFYSGEVAEAIEMFCAANGGIISQKDLLEYKPVWREPVLFEFRDLDIYTSGLPSSGGVVMGQILSMLETYGLEKYTSQSPEYLHLFTEAARLAYADREQFLGDPAFAHDFTEELLDQQYITTRLQLLDTERATPSTEIMPGVPKRQESDETTHLVVADKEGNIVSLTYTINLSYGSKAVVDGCGFLLNNEMDDFAIVPGVANAFGLTGGEANKIESGKRMLSSMAPTIILWKGQPYMALGSPGGSKIITAVAQTILNYRVFNHSITDAVNAPRIHHQWQPDILYTESGTQGIRVIQELISRGHTVKERTPFCAVMAIAYSKEGHFVTGAADSRRDGATVLGF